MASVALLLALAAPAGSRTPPPLTHGRYRPAGAYMYFARYRPGPPLHLDGHGIPRVPIGGRLVYDPVSIAQFGLYGYSRWRVGGSRARLRRARRAAAWLIRHQRPSGKFPYRFDFPLAGMDATMRAPWASAMAQGQAISLFTRLWRLGGRRAYLTAARRALRPLRRGVRRGGLTRRFHGHPFYEEYPSSPPSYTLNGFMFTLIGLWDLASTHRSPTASRLFRRGIRTLEIALPYYDTGGVSAYHLGYLTQPPRPRHTSAFYHRIHVDELQVLGSVWPSRTLRRWRRRWAAVRLPAQVARR